MATYFQGRKIVRVSDFTQSITGSAGGTAYQITLGAAPSGCLARFFTPLYNSNASLGNIQIAWASYNGTTWANRTDNQANMLSFANGGGGYTLSTPFIPRNNATIRAAALDPGLGSCIPMRVFDGDDFVNEDYISLSGIVGMILLPTERPVLYSGNNSAFTGTATCGLWEIY